jgi:endo-1,4-beta-xylanase
MASTQSDRSLELTCFTIRSQHGETYILENFGGYNPGTAGGQHKGTLTSDGGTYDIYRVDRGGGYIQFWSIRQGKRSSGIVTTKNHYDKYNSLGLVFDPAKNATYQILSTEGYQSTGSADMTVAEIVVGSDGTTSTVAPTCTAGS